VMAIIIEFMGFGYSLRMVSGTSDTEVFAGVLLLIAVFVMFYFLTIKPILKLCKSI